MNQYIEPAIHIRKKKSAYSKDEDFPGQPYPLSHHEKQTEEKGYCFESIAVQDIINSKQDYIVVADTGMGKTSLLLWLAPVYKLCLKFSPRLA